MIDLTNEQVEEVYNYIESNFTKEEIITLLIGTLRGTTKSNEKVISYLEDCKIYFKNEKSQVD